MSDSAQIDPHTLKKAIERGTDQEQIKDVLETGIPILAKKGRLGKAKVYSFNAEWLGKKYEQKRVEVIYVIENQKMITVTVYVFYGKWEAPQ
jgi:hypothetical protein